MTHRTEHDSLGPVRVPLDAYFGAQTQRALENFTVSGLRFSAGFIRALAMIKKSAALANHDLGLLPQHQAATIARVAQEIIDGGLLDQFMVDIFQTGSGTSINMNMNEVVAGRANELLAGARGGKEPVHPNDHVNLGQSSNDVVPSALHIAAFTGIRDRLLPGLKRLAEHLQQKSEFFADTLKVGRTHLQDAVPITLGQEFSGYTAQVELGIGRVERAAESLRELALGGTAVGTGLNAHPDFASRAIAHISKQCGHDFREAANHFEAQAAQDAALEVSGALKTLAASLVKIANDLRWAGSGPHCGLGEIMLPALQPGSSIMPGKVNPVIPEVVVQVAAQVYGNDAAITIGAQSGAFELNTMLPVITHNLLQSVELLAAAADVFAQRCIAGLTADRQRCAALVEQSLALATCLAPRLGYDKTADIVKQAQAAGKTIREVVVGQKILSAEEFEKIFSDITGGA